ncbi:Uncharacterized protein TCAP_04380 [Tolypocladium capitatum]|uniref:RING-type domain-containing protein n=1 Tax=Tolypocladium capitatum TaxID=45235 RepID=A0A2K3QDU3_9HYPO|nr:Uncharacterized protein TCAP_04380 [Tolypocladium capitatum]
MDPINYIPHSSQRLPSHSDPLHAHAGPWMSDTHDIATSPWPPHSSVPPLYFSQAQPPRPHSSSDPLQLGLQGALPHPDGGVRGQQQSQQLSFAAQSTPQSNHRGSALHPVSGLASAASMGQGGDLVSHPSEMPAGPALGHGGRGFTLQPQGAVNMGPPGATSEAHSLPARGSLSSSPDRLANAHGQPGASHPSTPHHHPFDLTPPRRAAQNLSAAASPPNTPRTYQQQSHGPAPSAPTTSRDNSALPSPVSDRRRQGYSRARRYMASRQTSSDPLHDNDADDDDGRRAASESAGGRPNRRGSQSSNHAAPWDEAAVRQLQLVRGAAPSKMVASRVALRSLQSVDMNELSDNERTCVICYNDFGVESPEGINEAPLRLPRCKHVFGDHCIKKWFEDSDSCPYCRDKLPSEPKHSQGQGSARAFMNMMRIRGVPLPAGVPDHFYSRLLGGSVGEAEFLDAMASRSGRSAERRSAPEDASGDDQRRTRQRRSSPSPHGPPPLPPGAGRSAARPASSTPSVQSLFASWRPGPNLWNPMQAQTAAEMRPATGSTRQQDAGQNRPVEQQQPPPSLFAAPSYQPPHFTFAPAASARAHARMAAHVQGQDLQRAAEQRAAEQRASMGSFSIRNAGQQPPEQQLQRQPAAGLFGGPSSNIPRLRPAPAGTAARGSPTRSSEQTQGETPPSLFGPNRNRPW